jgi:hypothetical protein
MLVVKAPRRLLLLGASLFFLVPLAVVTAGVFSPQVWWDLPVQQLAMVGWVSLALVAPLSWRLMMGRRGAQQTLNALLVLACVFLALRSLLGGTTFQGVWTLTVMLIGVGLAAWVRSELSQPYFDPRMEWFSGLPKAIARLEAWVNLEKAASEENRRTALFQVARIGSSGAFIFSSQGAMELPEPVCVEFRFRERSVRLEGNVVRQFYNPGSGWGVGIRFLPHSPDVSFELGEFLDAIQSEGCLA